MPAFETETKTPWSRTPTLLRLFIHPAVCGEWPRVVPPDLREKLLEFVPEPPAAQLGALEHIPVQPPRQWSSRHFDPEKRSVVYELHEVPLVQRLTEQAAIQDLRTMLRLIDQEKLSVCYSNTPRPLA